MLDSDRTTWKFLEDHVGVLTLFFCSIPYLGVLFYLAFVMHLEETALPPGPALFIVLGALGGITPIVGVGMIVRKLVREQNRFKIGTLAEAYVSLILVFASGYALLQSSQTAPSFEKMSRLWGQGEMGLWPHVVRMHDVFGDSLYLSVMTITTVGYGDLAPLSIWAKSLTALEGIVGIAFIGVAIGHYFSTCR